jgi:hypothetical protein
MGHADHMAPSVRKKLAITSLTSGCRSVGIVRSWTQTMEFLFFMSHPGHIYGDTSHVPSKGVSQEHKQDVGQAKGYARKPLKYPLPYLTPLSTLIKVVSPASKTQTFILWHICSGL